MPERTECELLQLARPALRHAELVDIARTNSPGKTQESAEKKWPPREAKAARFLAILRRDYGDDAFSRAVSLEQAGSNRRAQKEKGNNVSKTTDKAEILRALSLAEPLRRLQLLAEYGLNTELEKEIDLLIKNDTPYFWQADRAANQYQLLLGKKAKHGDEHPVLCFTNMKLSIDLDAWQSFMGWSDEELKDFVKGALVRLCSHHPADIEINGSWGIAAVREILNHFEFTDTFKYEVETWLVHACFMDDAYLFTQSTPDWYEQYLGKSVGRSRNVKRYQQVTEHASRMSAIADALVDRLTAGGWTMEQIRQEFLRWLQKHVGHLNTGFIVGVASAKCFSYNDKDLANQLHRMAQNMFKGMFSGGMTALYDPWLVNELGDYGMYSFRSAEDQALYTSNISETLSKGQIGQVWHIHQLLGDSITKLPLSAFAPDAIEKAIESGRYGTAAALVQHFPDSVDIYCAEERFRPQVEAEFAAKSAEFEADPSGKSKLKNLKAKINRKVSQLARNRRQQISGLMSLAMTLKQPITLDYSTPFVHSLNAQH